MTPTRETKVRHQDLEQSNWLPGRVREGGRNEKSEIKNKQPKIMQISNINFQDPTFYQSLVYQSEYPFTVVIRLGLGFGTKFPFLHLP